MSDPLAALDELVKTWRGVTRGMNVFGRHACADDLQAALSTLRASIEELTEERNGALRAQTVFRLAAEADKERIRELEAELARGQEVGWVNWDKFRDMRDERDRYREALVAITLGTRHSVNAAVLARAALHPTPETKDHQSEER